MFKKLTNEERFIFSQALLEVKEEKDIERVIEKAEGTILGLNKNAIKELKKFAKEKVEMKKNY